ncbi:MAG: YtxH domain-containing protein [Candidatus Binatia bacterium]
MSVIDRLREEYNSTMRRGSSMSFEDLLQALPSKNDLASAVGMQRRHTMAQDVASTLGLFGTGMLVGAGLALLFAPKPGQEMRKELAEKVSAGMESTGLVSSSQEPASRSHM